jgi:acetyltransferase-like isoleucine patch superfamily enzyme
MNRLREAVYRQGKERGYRFISYISSRATVFTGTPIGENCFILEDCTIQPYTRVGNNVVLGCGSQIAHHSVVDDHVSFASRAVVGGRVLVGPYCFLGLNSSVRSGVRLAEGTLVATGANVCRDTEPWSVYQGNPARKRRRASTESEVP